MTTSTEKFILDITQNVRANHPVTIVYTDDPNETLALIKASSNAVRGSTDGLFYWTATQRWTNITPTDRSLADLIANPVKVNITGDAAKTPLSFCFSAPEVVKAKKPVFVMSLLSTQFKADNIGILQELRDFDYITRNGINDSYRVIILANKSFEIPSDYDNIFGVVRHEPPTIIELEKDYDESFIKDYIEKVLCTLYEGPAETLVKQFTDLRKYCVNTLNGLTARQVRLILYKAVSQSVIRDGTKITGVDFNAFKEFVYDKKFEELSQSGILTLLKPTPMSQVGGFDLLKTWLDERRWAFTEEAREAQVDLPKGMALIGPPGTGKTWIARATADTLQQPCLQFNVDEVFNRFVGESEKNMKAALQVIEAMAPCVLFIDEIDKVFASMAGGGAGTDSGVTARVFGKLLGWLQDNKKEIFVIVTANRIQNIPSEFLRKGRLDEIWCVDFPTAKEREEIFKIHLTNRGIALKSLDQIVAATERFSSSEIEYIVKESVTQAAFKKEKLSEKHLLHERERVVPTSTAFADDIRRMREWAETHARPASTPQKIDIVDTTEVQEI